MYKLNQELAHMTNNRLKRKAQKKCRANENQLNLDSTFLQTFRFLSLDIERLMSSSKSENVSDRHMHTFKQTNNLNIQ